MQLFRGVIDFFFKKKYLPRYFQLFHLEESLLNLIYVYQGIQYVATTLENLHLVRALVLRGLILGLDLVPCNESHTVYDPALEQYREPARNPQANSDSQTHLGHSKPVWGVLSFPTT